jgi:hypothetical protein
MPPPDSTADSQPLTQLTLLASTGTSPSDKETSTTTMSRWLKSVNNLLDNLDGQAENVAEGVGDGIDTTIGQLLEKGQQVAKGFQGDGSFDSDSSDNDYDDDEDELYTSDEDKLYKSEEDIEEEDLNDEDEDAQDGKAVARNDSKDSKATINGSAHFSIGVHSGSSSYVVDSVSDITCAERCEYGYTEELITEDVNSARATEATPSGITDKTPNPPNRLNSFSRPAPKQVDDSPSSDQVEGQLSVHAKFSPKIPGQLFDVSPQQPRRSLDKYDLQKYVDQVRLEHDTDSDSDDGGGASGGSSVPSQKIRDSEHSAGPPKPPTRQTSLKKTNLPKLQKHVASAPASVQTSFQKPPKTPPRSRGGGGDVQKLMAKLQSMQEELNKTTSQLKTSQAETKKLEKQVNSLDIQLEATNSEIHAQVEELRRAGERMEKDRKLAQDDREELLDEQDDEIEQLKALHTTEVSDLKSSYGQQITDLTNRLQVEETLRMQEDGDWTKELEDAVGRERDALKKLSEINMEKFKVESSASKLTTQQTALQTKLASALQSVKEAAEREREAEDKLDAALSLHARQLTQRQRREAELEKTIFEIGSALTVAQQKQQRQLVQPLVNTENGDRDSYKDKFEAAEEEAETLKVQLNFETQRREALQQELNDISQERSEEISSAQARQQQHDRKVAGLESTIARSKKSLQDLKTGNSATMTSTSGGQTARLTSELAESKQEVARLSDQLLRHQRLAETSKSEILALKGRLQSATARAEEAEKSLVSAQSSSDYPTRRTFDVEGGGGAYPNPMASTRRRVKGSGRLRTASAGSSVRSALNIGPGRTNYVVEQVVVTVDALDKWMVDTGGFMRHEPFARLGFLVYLMTLHIWTFALVAFHTVVEVPHGDFGSMDNNPRHWRNHA